MRLLILMLIMFISLIYLGLAGLAAISNTEEDRRVTIAVATCKDQGGVSKVTEGKPLRTRSVDCTINNKKMLYVEQASKWIGK